MHRRKFIQGTSAAAAMLAATGVSAKSYAQIQGANDRIRLGGIGSGDRGRTRLVAAQKLGAQIVALADVNKAMLERAQKDLGAPVEKTYVDYSDLLARKDLDGVIIAAPDHLHRQILLDSVRAGKDAYIEKPLARTIKEGDDIVSKVKMSKQIVQVGNQRRSGEHFKRAREIVASGGIGDIRFIRIWDFRYRPRDPYIKRSADATQFSPELIDWNRFLARFGPEATIRPQARFRVALVLGLRRRPDDRHRPALARRCDVDHGFGRPAPRHLQRRELPKPGLGDSR